MKSNKTKWLLIIIAIIFVNIIVFKYVNFDKKTMSVVLEVKANQSDIYQMFYSHGEPFGDKFYNREYKKSNNYEELTFVVPCDVAKLRIDFGNQIGDIYLKNIGIKYLWKEYSVPKDTIINEKQRNDIESIESEGDVLKVISKGSDPILTFNASDLPIPNIEKVNKFVSQIIKILSSIICTIAIIVISKFLPGIWNLCKEIYYNRKLIITLSKNDFKTRFAGSYLGITWAFVQPIVVVLIYWFVFQVGFKSAPMEDFPFLLWLIAGIVPWFFFNEGLMNATNSLVEYSYLVKKVVFKISVLPIVKVISALYVHVFFVLFANIIYLLYGYTPTIYMVQAVYYSICTFVLVLGISYMTSAIIVFFKDLGQIVNILLQFGMWMTPVMWSYDMMPQSLQWVLKLNPMYYIVEGYRDTFIRHVWFWERYNQTIYFWIVTLCIFVVGTLIFKKTKPHFSDVL